MDQEQQKMMYDIADKFINLANELSKSEQSGGIGARLDSPQPDTAPLKHQH